MLTSHPFYYNIFYFLFPINVHKGRQFQFYLTTKLLLTLEQQSLLIGVAAESLLVHVSDEIADTVGVTTLVVVP